MTNALHHLLLGGSFLLLLSGCRPPPPPVAQRQVAQLHAEVETSPARRDQLPAMASQTFHQLGETLADLDGLKPGSDLNKLNRTASSIRLQVARNTFRLVDLAHHYSERTDGAYDLTSVPLEHLWGMRGAEPPAVEPEPELIAGVLQGIGFEHVELFDQGAVAYTTVGTQVGLDLIGQAYAVDLAILELRRLTYADARVQLAGAHRVLGRQDAQQPWRIDVPHPFLTNASIGTVRLSTPHPALVVLRLRENELTIGTNTYGHFINPNTGRPASGTALSAVLAPSATMASALAQALIVAGAEQAETLLARFPKCEALVIPDRQPAEVWRSGGFAQRLELDPDLGWSVIPLNATAQDSSTAAAEPATPAP
jgi:thiamine biosynthesis lipoprotein